MQGIMPRASRCGCIGKMGASALSNERTSHRRKRDGSLRASSIRKLMGSLGWIFSRAGPVLMSCFAHAAR